MTVRVLHVLNQFFAGLGGEEQASMPARIEIGARGPGRLLERLAPDFQVVATLAFGDDWAAQDLDAAVARMLALAEEAAASQGPFDLVLAGPAFLAGRYGLACGAFCRAARERLGVPAATALHPESPGADVYRRDVPIARAGRDAMGMQQAMARLVRIGTKLVRGEPLDPDGDELLLRGLRENFFRQQTGARRAVAMLLQKLSGEPFVTEYAPPPFDRVPPAPPVANLASATVALVTSGGIVPRGNPDHIEAASASRFGSYSLVGLARLSSATHQTAHGGYDPTHANADPNRVVPLDVMRALEDEGAIGRLYPRYFATVGNGTSVARARRFGEEIAAQLVSDGVQAVILTST